MTLTCVMVAAAQVRQVEGFPWHTRRFQRVVPDAVCHIRRPPDSAMRRYDPFPHPVLFWQTQRHNIHRCSSQLIPAVCSQMNAESWIRQRLLAFIDWLPSRWSVRYCNVHSATSSHQSDRIYCRPGCKLYRRAGPVPARTDEGRPLPIDTRLSFAQANKLIRDLRPRQLVVPEVYTSTPALQPGTNPV